ncbi:PTS 2-O-a-mannosyl-D-glycerate transporter subunit IIABC [Halobacillus naozhouensis]|uniref:PTS 2-O-a-mannosyl-D-glycerate transporter subunit IIABC n=1 Tax=Halobacillus naozhouensis TaxID=554880 RepID=A0ABY8IVG3_9BACI|nr:PTS 2-O-a-mannosyl-D-glycerate transporter subunit IIABC [Halobacillus naozhouensis]WFT73960.1 PTS 2-O-a-mannosyl-D-glycerate transporter subunit IIABC [Halobacillus naozhouensis]
MRLQSLTSSDLISTYQSFSTKDEAIRYLVDQLNNNGKLHSKEDFYQAVIEREALSPTGFEGGLAIPHGKSKAVKEAAFAVATLETPLEDWESIEEENRVELVMLLAIPKEEAGSTHLNLLAELMTRLADPTYKERLMQAKTSDQFFAALDHEEEEKESSEQEVSRTILAVTACPAGIAHTYMAAEALVRAGKELNVKVAVEKQGANGIEDRHSKRHVIQADAVIFAADVAVKDPERFSKLPKVKTTVAAPLKNAKGILEEAIAKSDQAPTSHDNFQEIDEEEEPESKPFKTEIKDSIMTGISYIIPIIVAGGMTLAFAVLVSQAFGLQEVYAEEGSWLWLLRQLGGTMLGTLMVPVLSAYMAYSIADKPALGPGFAAGIAANLIGSGFLGGMLGGFLAGYIIKFLKKNVQTSGTFAGFVSFWLYPVVGTLSVGAIMLFVIGEPLAAINTGLINWLEGLSGGNAILLGIILGAMVSFDLGGPVNKAAYTFCIGAMASGNIMPYAAFASVKMVSAFAVTGATIIGRKYFTKPEQEVGKQTWLLGLAGITEGAIPFMINDPLRVIPSLVAGSAVTGGIVAYFGIGLNVPGAGIFSLALLEGPPLLTAASIWFGAAILGAFISMILLIITRKNKLKKQSRTLEAEENIEMEPAAN